METQMTISPEEIKRRLDRGEIGFILDLRNADGFAAWRIEGRSDVDTMNIPQVDFIGGETHIRRNGVDLPGPRIHT